VTSLQRLFLVFGLSFPVILVMAIVPTFQPAESLPDIRNVVTPTPSRPIPTPTPTSGPTEVELKIEGIERRLDDIQALVEVQSSTYDATVTRVESNFNLLLAILAIASLLTAILGFGFVRIWIRSLVEDQLKQITSREISHLIEREVHRLRDEWEPKFVELYEEYQKATKGGHHER
jgi:hypothetical protein